MSNEPARTRRRHLSTDSEKKQSCSYENIQRLLIPLPPHSSCLIRFDSTHAYTSLTLLKYFNEQRGKEKTRLTVLYAKGSIGVKLTLGNGLIPLCPFNDSFPPLHSEAWSNAAPLRGRASVSANLRVSMRHGCQTEWGKRALASRLFKT